MKIKGDFWGQDGGHWVALKMFDHGSVTGNGFLNRIAPIGGCANRIPKNRSTWTFSNVSKVPEIRPNLVITSQFAKLLIRKIAIKTETCGFMAATVIC